MNKRIRELAEQAGQLQLATPDNPSADAIMVLIGPNIEKFAELIVRECIQVSKPVLDEPYEDMSEFAKGLVEGQDVAIEKIKQHFGVGEK